MTTGRKEKAIFLFIIGSALAVDAAILYLAYHILN